MTLDTKSGVMSQHRTESQHIAEDARIEELDQLRDPEESLLLRNNETEPFYPLSKEVRKLPLSWF